MSFKGRFLVLRRVRAGDQDLLVRAYGFGGVVSVFVKDGLLSSCGLFGVFEPFNVVVLDLSQRGDVAIPNDVLGVERLSYLCTRFERFLWMCWVAGFILRHVSFYDEKLFELFLRYLTTDTEGREGTYRIRLRLEYLDLSGLSPKFLTGKIGGGKLRLKLSDGSVSPGGEVEVEPGVLRVIRRVYRTRKVENLVVSPALSRKAEKLLDRFIEFHSR